MGLFGSSKSSSVAAPPKKPTPDVVRMMTLRSTKEEDAIANLLREQQAQQMSALEQERRAVNEVAERERQMLAHIATMQTQLAEQQEEVDRARKAEEDLHKALRLAAERLSGVTSSEQGLRSELDKTRQQLADASIEIQHLRARLFGEKGVRLEPLRAGADLQPSAPALRGGGGGGGFGGFGGGGGGGGGGEPGGLLDALSGGGPDALPSSPMRNFSMGAGLGDAHGRSAGHEWGGAGAEAAGDGGALPPSLERGRWHILRVPGADHSLGTWASDKSDAMFRELFAILDSLDGGSGLPHHQLHHAATAGGGGSGRIKVGSPRQKRVLTVRNTNTTDENDAPRGSADGVGSE